MNADGTIIAVTNGAAVLPGPKAVRVYQLQNDLWTQLGSDILGPADEERFGSALAFSDDGLVLGLGSWYDADISGRAQVFEFDGIEWIEKGPEFIGAPFSQLGRGLDLNADGSRIIIGLPGIEQNGLPYGEARIFDFDGSQWSQIGNAIEANREFDFLGTRVRISGDGNRIVCNATNVGGGSNPPGEIHVYDLINGQWALVGDVITGAMVGERIGLEIDMSSDGAYILASAPFSGVHGSNAGVVRLFAFNGSEWYQIGLDVHGLPQSFFGQRIAVSDTGERFITGSPSYNGDGTSESRGRVELFEFNANEWMMLGEEIIGNPMETLGQTVEMSHNGNTFLVGSPVIDDNGVDAGCVEVFGVGLLGIDETIFKGRISIYPNPVDLAFNYSKPANLEINSIEILDVYGRQVLNDLTGSWTENQMVNTAGLKSGIYLILFSFNNHTFIAKFVKR